jgi:hypothetical protein
LRENLKQLSRSISERLAGWILRNEQLLLSVHFSDHCGPGDRFDSQQAEGSFFSYPDLLLSLITNEYRE